MRTRPIVVVLTVMMFLAGWSLCQSESPSEPSLLNVSVVQVKYDMIQEFEALQKEMSGALKEAGSPFRHVWQVARGATNEYHIVTPAENFAEFDQPSLSAKAMGEEGFAAWVAKVTKCIQARSVLTLRSVPGLSIPPKDGAATNLAVLTTRDALPGRGRDYATWMREKLLPAAKKAGVTGFSVYRPVFGGSDRGWTTVTLADNWAALDQDHPIVRSLSQAELAELFGPVGEMTASGERIVIRYRPELSIQ